MEVPSDNIQIWFSMCALRKHRRTHGPWLSPSQGLSPSSPCLSCFNHFLIHRDTSVSSSSLQKSWICSEDGWKQEASVPTSEGSQGFPVPRNPDFVAKNELSEQGKVQGVAAMPLRRCGLWGGRGSPGGLSRRWGPVHPRTRGELIWTTKALAQSSWRATRLR